MSNTKRGNVILLFLMIYFNCSLWFMQYNSAICIFLSILSVLVYQMVYYKKIIFNKKCIGAFLIVLMIITISELINQNTQTFIVQSFTSWFIALFIASSMPLKEFEKAYVSVMYIIALFSIIIFAGLFINRNIYVHTPLIHTTKWIGSTAVVHNLFVGVVNTNVRYIRNWGIFYEPGMFAFYLNIAIYILLIKAPQINIKRSAVLIIAVLTTTSTNGYISLALILITCFVKKEIANKSLQHGRWKFIIIIGIIIAAAIVFFMNNEARREFLLGKLNIFKNNTVSGSGYERVNAVRAAWKTFIANPIIGVGISGFSRIVKGQIGSFTPLQWFAQYGVIYGMFCNLEYARYAINKDEHLIVNIFGIASIISMIVSQGMTLNIIVLTLILYMVRGEK